MSWKRLRGHDALVRAFQHVIRRGRLAHAYLFAGPPGVGKKLFATELAKTLLCEQGGQDACDVCPSCVQIDGGTHPDVFAVRRPEDSNVFPIETMRELCAGFALKAARGRGKVAIVDDADDLASSHPDAANCFLKTLEEPPPRSVIVLIGTSADRQLATIVSRCQVVNFGRLRDADVVDLLRAGGVADEELLERLLHVSAGSPGVAAAFSDPGLWEFRRSFLGGLASLPAGGVALSKTWTEFVEEAGKESAAQRRRASSCVGLLVAFLQDVLHHRLGLPVAAADEAEKKALEVVANRLEPEPLMALIERCLEAAAQIDRYVQLVLVLEALTDALGQRLSVRTAPTPV